MNEYEITYTVKNSGSGVVRERIEAASEQNARELVRAKFGRDQVVIQGGHQTRFGDRDDRSANRR